MSAIWREPVSEEQKEPDKEPEPQESIPADIAKSLESAPPQFRKIFAEMGMIHHSTGVSPVPNALLDKINSTHIDKFLDYNHKEDENIYKLQSSGRWFHLSYVAMVLSFLVFLVVYLSGNNQSLLIDILKLLVIFAGGFGSGFGVKSYLDKKK